MRKETIKKSTKAGELALPLLTTVWQQPQWCESLVEGWAYQLSYHPGPQPGLWVGPLWHLTHLWAARAHKGAGLVNHSHGISMTLANSEISAAEVRGLEADQGLIEMNIYMLSYLDKRGNPVTHCSFQCHHNKCVMSTWEWWRSRVVHATLETWYLWQVWEKAGPDRGAGSLPSGLCPVVCNNLELSWT